MAAVNFTQRRGVVTLIPKADSDTLKLTDWRPITLLNVDYKIASKAIATRIKKYFPQLIHTDLTGFMKDRFTGKNVRLLCDILEQTELENMPGILLQQRGGGGYLFQASSIRKGRDITS